MIRLKKTSVKSYTRYDKVVLVQSWAPPTPVYEE